MNSRERDEMAEEIESVGRAGETFRKRAALVIAVMGLLLAIASLGGGNAMKETIDANIRAADTYAFYQARNLRQDLYTATADLTETLGKDPSAYRAKAEREGQEKAALLDEARKHEAERTVAQRRDTFFDYARALYEIAIVLGSISIMTASGQLLGLSGVLALAATVLSVNGFLLLV